MIEEWDKIERELAEIGDEAFKPVFRFWTAVGVIAFIVIVVIAIVGGK